MLKADIFFVFFFFFFTIWSCFLQLVNMSQGLFLGGGKNWLLRKEFTLKWDLFTQINVKQSSVCVSYVTSDFSDRNGMKTHQAKLWLLPSNTLNGDLCTWVSQMPAATEAWASLWTTQLQESYPIPPHLPTFLYFQQIWAGIAVGSAYTSFFFIIFLQMEHLKHWVFLIWNFVWSCLTSWPDPEIFSGSLPLQLFILLWDKDNLTFSFVVDWRVPKPPWTPDFSLSSCSCYTHFLHHKRNEPSGSTWNRRRQCLCDQPHHFQGHLFARQINNASWASKEQIQVLLKVSEKEFGLKDDPSALRGVSVNCGSSMERPTGWLGRLKLDREGILLIKLAEILSQKLSTGRKKGSQAGVGRGNEKTSD